jgi:hypothetical protein
LKTKSLLLAFTLASIASAQTAQYPGVGVLSGGSGDVGAHSGEQLDLRFYGELDAIYDTGLEPFSINSQGQLVQVNGLAGLQAALGVYGVHVWRRAQLGIDYRGTFRYYPDNTYYDGSDQALHFTYSVQPNRRINLSTRLTGGTSSLGLVSPALAYAPGEDTVEQPSLLLFDNRTYYLESGMNLSYLLDPRTSITVGGSGFFVDHHSAGLVNTEGYTVDGTFMRRITRGISLGANYKHMYYEFPGNFGESTVNQYTVRYKEDFGRSWTASVNGGVYQVESIGAQEVSFSPVVAALLGTSSGLQAFDQKDTYPAADARLTRKFKTAQISGYYTLGIAPGDGVYLTSRQNTTGASFSYTGVRHWSFSVAGGYYKLIPLTQAIKPFSQINGSAGVTYAIGKGFHATARVDGRQQVIDVNGYQRDSYRATVGVIFSPGPVPISLW